jgi:outer membrane protein assembly factor BamB
MSWKHLGRIAVLAGCLLALVTAAAPRAAADSPAVWPQWRGPLATGAAPEGQPPVRWSETDNVRWKVELPGRGHSTPIVWGQKVFVTSAEPAGDGGRLRFLVLALDLATGELLWQRDARQDAPTTHSHPDSSWASPSPVTDGEVVCASFGSFGIFCYDLDGQLLWSKDLGDLATRRDFGEGSSPLLAGEALVVNWDHEGDSFIVALDRRTGRELWRHGRDEVTSWSTPLAVEVDGRTQVVVSASGRIRGYDLASGEEIWQAAGMTLNVVPSPVAGDGLVFAASGFRGNALLALELAGAEGDLTGGPRVRWSHDRDTPYVPSPLLYRGILYFLKHNRGILTAVDAAGGEVLYGPERLEGVEGAYASPVAAGDRLYVLGRNGATCVLRHGRRLEVLAVNRLDDRFEASPAVAGDTLLLRGHRFLYALAEEPAETGGAEGDTAAEAPSGL